MFDAMDSLIDLLYLALIFLVGMVIFDILKRKEKTQDEHVVTSTGRKLYVKIEPEAEIAE